MLDIVFLVIFLVMAFRIARTVMQESAIFQEFNQSKSLGAVVLLFPLGPIALLVLPFRLGWLPAVLMAAVCYLPAMVISRQRLHVFSSSGTDRTRKAVQAASQSFGTALLGFIYIGIFLVFIAISSE